jgi:hypothetical protein
MPLRVRNLPSLASPHIGTLTLPKFEYVLGMDLKDNWLKLHRSMKPALLDTYGYADHNPETDGWSLVFNNDISFIEILYDSDIAGVVQSARCQ